jgi:hypothetical protein
VPGGEVEDRSAKAHDEVRVVQLRLAVTAQDYDQALRFYRRTPPAWGSWHPCWVGRRPGERLTSPLTVRIDLQKRSSAQR